MAQVILTQAGTGASTMRLRVDYTVGVGYINISGLAGSRTDGYTSQGDPVYVHLNGDAGWKVTPNPQFPAKNNWKAWGNPNKTLYTSATNFTITFTFSGTSVANIKNTKFIMTVAIPQPSPVNKPTVSGLNTSSITLNSFAASFSVTNNGGGTITGYGIQVSTTNFGGVVKSAAAYSTTFSGMGFNTTYYVRGYATNSAGTTYTAVSAVKTLDMARLGAVPSTVDADEDWTVPWSNGGTSNRHLAIYQDNSTEQLVPWFAVAGTNYTFEADNYKDIFYNDMKNVTSKKYRVYLRSQDQVFLDEYKHVTVNITNAEPIVTATHVDVNQDVIDITQDNTLLLRGVSNLEVTPSVVGNKGATIVSIKVNGIPYTGTPIVLEGYEEDAYTIEATDSRSNKTIQAFNITYLEYTPITGDAEFYRTAAFNNEIKAKIEGTFYDGIVGIIQNEINIKYRYKLKDDEDFTEWEVIPIDNMAEGKYEIEHLLPHEFPYVNQIIFEVLLEDSFVTRILTYEVLPSYRQIHVTENVQVLFGRLHIQKLYKKGALQFIFDFVYDTITRTWVLHVYSLPQMFETQHVFRADVNARSIISPLNVGNNPLVKYTIKQAEQNYQDFVLPDTPQKYGNVTVIDTGIIPLENEVQKRMRELHFTSFRKGAHDLKYYVSVYVDSRNIIQTDRKVIDYVNDPDDPDFGKLYEIIEDVANVFGETRLGEWILSHAQFPHVALVKSHLRLHGRGYFVRVVVVNRDEISHEFSNLALIYRIMGGR